MVLSCEQSTKFLSDLLAGQIEPTAAKELAAHLAACESCDAQVNDLVWQDLTLAELAGQSLLPTMMARLHAGLAPEEPRDTPDASRMPPQPERLTTVRLAHRFRDKFSASKERFAVGVAAAAAILVVGIGLWSWRLRAAVSRQAVAVAHVERVEGQVLLLAGREKRSATIGQALLRGQGLEVCGDSMAVVVCPDSTRFELDAETTVQWARPDDSASHSQPSGICELSLIQGAITAEVAHQPPDRPLVLRTDDAEVVVRGTRLRLSKLLDSTHVATEEGLVEVRRLNDRKSVEVPAGSYATITPRAEPLAVRRLHPPTSDTRGLFDQRYGPDPQNVLDLWRASSGGPSAVAVFFHAGAYHGGDKARVPSALLEHCLPAGIAVAAVNYRSGAKDHFPAPMIDAARALQFLRLHAKDWNFDTGRIAAAGEGFGGVLALWIALHDDLADPAAEEPVARQSTRVSCVAARSAPTSFDPQFLEETVGRRDARRDPWLLRFLGLRPDEWDTLRARRLCDEASPISYTSPDDPPVLLIYHAGRQWRPPRPLQPNVSWAGEALKERLEAVGGTVRMGYGDDYRRCDCQDRMYRDIVQFFLEQFERSPRVTHRMPAKTEDQP